MINLLTTTNTLILQTVKQMVDTKNVDPDTVVEIREAGLSLYNTAYNNIPHLDYEDALVNVLSDMERALHKIETIDPSDCFSMIVVFLTVSSKIERVLTWMYGVDIEIKE